MRKRGRPARWPCHERAEARLGPGAAPAASSAAPRPKPPAAEAACLHLQRMVTAHPGLGAAACLATARWPAGSPPRRCCSCCVHCTNPVSSAAAVPSRPVRARKQGNTRCTAGTQRLPPVRDRLLRGGGVHGLQRAHVLVQVPRERMRRIRRFKVGPPAPIAASPGPEAPGRCGLCARVRVRAGAGAAGGGTGLLGREVAARRHCGCTGRLPQGIRMNPAGGQGGFRGAWRQFRSARGSGSRSSALLAAAHAAAAAAAGGWLLPQSARQHQAGDAGGCARRAGGSDCA